MQATNNFRLSADICEVDRNTAEYLERKITSYFQRKIWYIFIVNGEQLNINASLPDDDTMAATRRKHIREAAQQIFIFTG